MLGLVTADVAAPLDPDLSPFASACRSRLGAGAVRVVSWDDPNVVWSDFDRVIIRSTWDYTDRLDEFLAWLDRAGSATTVLNSPDTVRWNTDKRYLEDLADAGVPIAPTTFVPPGVAPPAVNGLHIVKPTVGAGSSGALRCGPDDAASAVAEHVGALHGQGLTAMVQPYLAPLDEMGETALCFVPSPDGRDLELSHAFRKGAILTSTVVEQEGGLFAKEDISPRVPSEAELDVARRVLETEIIRSFERIVFARIDIAPTAIPDGSLTHVVMEVELIEPSFYLNTSPGAAELFADRLAIATSSPSVS